MCDNAATESVLDEKAVEEASVEISGDAAELETGEDGAPAEQAPAPAAPPLMPVDPALLEGITAKLGALEQQFSRRFAYDVGKEKILDKLHAELQGYKSDLYAKLTKPIFHDIAVVLDDLRKMSIGLNEQAQEPAALLVSIADSLICTLDKYEVTPFSSAPGSKYQATTQRMVRVQPTQDAALVGHIAQSVSPGYVRGGQIIYPEKVTVYKMEVN